MHTNFLSKNLKERDQVRDLVIDGKILNHILKETWVKRWTGFSGLRIGSNNGIL
jgi:hypothetical protein